MRTLEEVKDKLETAQAWNTNVLDSVSESYNQAVVDTLKWVIEATSDIVSYDEEMF